MSSSSHSHLENQVRGITERTPLLPQPQAEETEPIQASAQNVHDEEAEPLPWSILVPALGSLWLVLFLAAMDGTIGKSSPSNQHSHFSLTLSLSPFSSGNSRLRHLLIFQRLREILLVRFILSPNSLCIFSNLR